MNKSKRRMISLALALLLMLCNMAMPASAARVGWTDPDGTYNVAIVTKTSNWYYHYKEITDATIARHTYGTQSLITWPVGNTASYSVSISAGLYTSKVKEALILEGLTECVMGAAVQGDKGYYVIDVGVPTGTYSYGYEITVYDISWRVDLDAPQSGTIGYAASAGSLSGAEDAVPSYITGAKLIPAG